MLPQQNKLLIDLQHMTYQHHVLYKNYFFVKLATVMISQIRESRDRYVIIIIILMSSIQTSSIDYI